MDDSLALACQTLTLAGRWGSIFAFDLGRYVLGAALVTALLWALPRASLELRRVRIRPEAPERRAHEVRNSLIAVLTFSLVGLGVYHGGYAGVFQIYGEVAEYGVAYWIASLALIIVAHDAFFYWTHRWLHFPRLFSRVHRTHHLSVAPTQWAAYSFSVGEALTQAAFLPLYLLLAPTHTSVLFVWMAHQVLRNVFGHCGVELEPRAWLASWWGRWLTTTLHHDMHHACGRCNYGLYFTWWDRWCGTEHPDYRARLEALVERTGPRAGAHIRQRSAT